MIWDKKYQVGDVVRIVKEDELVYGWNTRKKEYLVPVRITSVNKFEGAIELNFPHRSVFHVQANEIELLERGGKPVKKFKTESELVCLL